jgi:pimeloyl-ACP methyl ester carboxylesterase
MALLTIAAADGTALSVRDTGRRDGTTVLLCDGVGCDGYIWRYLRPHLEKTCRVVHFHYRGHGQSEIPQDRTTLTIEQCAEDAWHVLDQLGIQEAVLVGHSMGVQVILEAAWRQRARTRGVVALCGAFERPLDTFHGSDFGHRILPLVTGAAFRWPTKLRDLWQRLVPTEMAWKMAVATELNAAMVRRDDFIPYLQHMARMDPVIFVHYLQAVADHSARPWLRSLRMPVLVVAGERDNFTPAHVSERMLNLLPNAQYCLVPTGSHAAPIELPDLIELKLDAFVRHHGLW